MHVSDHKKQLLIESKSVILKILLILLVLQQSCKEKSELADSTFVNIVPSYGNLHLVTLPDTLHFKLASKTYNEIKSINCYFENGKSYISFYDRRSESVNIYDYSSRELIKRIELKKSLKSSRYYKVSVYAISMDTILVTNLGTLYIVDSSGNIHKKLPFFDRIDAMAYYETPVPVVVKDDTIYMGVRPFVKETSLTEIRNWKTLYAFDSKTGKYELHYPLPQIYRDGLFGRRFMTYSYCLNENGNFVFSFPADTNIYETNLTDFHQSYYAKSKFQLSPINPISKLSLENDEGGKEYVLRDSYGSIYFDRYKKRYWRIAKQKVDKAVLGSPTAQRTSSIILLNEDFKIIGEFKYNYDFSLDEMLFLPDGKIFSRVKQKDEFVLHFVQLTYSDQSNSLLPLASK